LRALALRPEPTSKSLEGSRAIFFGSGSFTSRLKRQPISRATFMIAYISGRFGRIERSRMVVAKSKVFKDFFVRRFGVGRELFHPGDLLFAQGFLIDPEFIKRAAHPIGR
jgi:hypothetical protein